VQTSLEAAEWRDLFAEALRLSGFWARTASLAVVIAVAALGATALGARPAPAVGIAATALAVLGVFSVGYAVVGPRLRWPRLSPAARHVRWQVHADRIEAERGTARITLDWHDVDQVVVTRRLIVLHLGERREVLGLPRRAATALGEALITNWAEDSGAEVVRRRGAVLSAGGGPSRAGSA
jgi:hypothetical protein